VQTSRLPHPATAANIAMSQVDFPAHIVMWTHRLVWDKRLFRYKKKIYRNELTV
jgi:hypothetical protein